MNYALLASLLLFTACAPDWNPDQDKVAAVTKACLDQKGVPYMVSMTVSCTFPRSKP